MIVALVTIILIIVIGITSRDRQSMTVVESTIGQALSPVQKVLHNVGESISGTFGSVASISQLKGENERLKEELLKLEKQNRVMDDIISRSDHLRNEAILKETSTYRFVDAQIVGRDPGNWFDRFIIDKGTKHGINKGDPVVQGIEVDGKVVEEGLIGRIIEVGDNWAKVMSIIDEGSNVSFKVIRTQDGGILSGSFQANLEGYLFDADADVFKGDKLITSGLGGNFMRDLYIGEITEVTKRGDELMKTITVKPAVNFNKLNDVLVIIGNKE